MPTPRQAFLVPRLRWAAESFQTYSRSRVDLAVALGQVLDALDADGDGPCWTLDCQSSLLEDYLAAVPDDRARLARHLSAGRVVAGPWYILPDTYLCGGESLARNLLLGHRTGAELGPVHAVGCLPGPTGLTAQLPQLLDLAGLDSCFFTSVDTPRFAWAAPNGSRVLAVGVPEPSGPSLLPAMPDNEPALICLDRSGRSPQADLAQAFEDLQAAHPGTDCRTAVLSEFLTAARERTPDEARPLHTGALLDVTETTHFDGAWSARIYQKQADEACRALLVRGAEPLLAAGRYLHGDPWPGGLLDNIWRDLLRCHAQDLLGGRGTDSVHKDLDTRLAGVRQTTEQLLVHLMDRTAPPAQPGGGSEIVITVANSLPFRRDEVVERLVVIPPSDTDPGQLRLLDEEDRQVPFRIVDRMFVSPLPGVDYRRELFCVDQWNTLSTYLDRMDTRILGTEADRDTRDSFLTIQFLARDLPAVGHRQYVLTDAKTRTQPARPFPPLSAREDEGTVTLENEKIRVTLNPDGTFDLENLATGRIFDGLNLLEDTEDCGDAGDYAAAPIGGTFFSGGVEGRVRLVEQSDLLCRAEASFKFILPRSLERDRRNRSQRTARCDVRVTLTLRTGSPLVEVETDLNNHAFDHRLRAWFPTGLKTETALSDGVYHLDRRPLTEPDSPDARTWPQRDFTLLQGPNEGLVVFNRGLPEFQAWTGHDGKAVYALTLLRCVDWLARDDLARGDRKAPGGVVFTPDAQCYGPHTFRYAVASCGPDPLGGDIKGLSEAYRMPPVTWQGGGGPVRPGGRSLLEKSNPRVAVSAIKQADADDRLIVRLVNLGDTRTTETLTCGLPVLEACQVDLLERNMVVDCAEPVIGRSGLRVDITLDPFQIITLALTIDKEA